MQPESFRSLQPPRHPHTPPEPCRTINSSQASSACAREPAAAVHGWSFGWGARRDEGCCRHTLAQACACRHEEAQRQERRGEQRRAGPEGRCDDELTQAHVPRGRLPRAREQWDTEDMRVEAPSLSLGVLAVRRDVDNRRRRTLSVLQTLEPRGTRLECNRHEPVTGYTSHSKVIISPSNHNLVRYCIRAMCRARAAGRGPRVYPRSHAR